jgi:hypothetical protein
MHFSQLLLVRSNKCIKITFEISIYRHSCSHNLLPIVLFILIPTCSLPLTSIVCIRLVNRIYQTHLIGWWSLHGSGSQI